MKKKNREVFFLFFLKQEETRVFSSEMGGKRGFFISGREKRRVFLFEGGRTRFFYQENKGLFTIKWRQGISFYFLKHGFSV